MHQDLFSQWSDGHSEMLLIGAAKPGKVNKIIDHLDLLVDTKLFAGLTSQMFGYRGNPIALIDTKSNYRSKRAITAH
jgi:hypothetical protein